MDKKLKNNTKIDKKLISASNLPDISDQKYKIEYRPIQPEQPPPEIKNPP